VRALIVEPGFTRGALAATRALAAAGWVVGVGTPTGTGLAASSHHAAHRHRVSSPEHDRDRFIESVNSAIAEGGYQVVLPGSDAGALALSEWRARVDAIVPFADHSSVVRAFDKLQLAAAVGDAGLAVLETVEATPEAISRWRGPALVKASRHATFEIQPGPGRLEPRLAADRDAMSARAREIRAVGGVPLLQEAAAGRLIAFSVVTDHDSNVVARVHQVADRIFPPHLGISVRARTVRPEPTLANGVEALLRLLGWFGLAQLQFLAPEDDEPHLIDFNGRLYGSLGLAIGARVNLPAVWAALATGRTHSAHPDAVPGARYQWLEGDLRRAARERRGGLLSDLWGTLSYSRGTVPGIWNPRDPRPAVHYIAERFVQAVRAMRRGRK
jgi:hypothetical protein